MQRDYIELGYIAENSRVKLTQGIELVGHKDITDGHIPPPLTASSATLTLLPSPLLDPTSKTTTSDLTSITYLTRYISRNAPQARPQRDQDHLPPSYRW
jgi:hypothetical protein